MGNAVAKKFDVPKEHTATAGHLQLWQIWPGKSKDASGQLVSIWTFDKSEYAKRKTTYGSTLDKNVVEQVFQIMKKDLAVMKESQACPHMISTLEVLEDSKNGLIFTTERIVCSLADIFHNFENIVGGKVHHVEFFNDGDTVTEIEISRAFLSLAEGIQYMHNVQRRLHLNISPENIVITASGQWKLCGFGLSLTFQQGEQQRIASPYYLKAPISTPNQPLTRLEPNLAYLPPECTDGGYNPPGVRFLSPQCDLFSLALVLYEIYRYNLALSPTDRLNYRPILPITNNDVNQHHMSLDLIPSFDYSFLPPGIDRLITGLLQLNVSYRLTSSDIINNAYFVTGNQAVINTLELLHTRDVGTQSSQLISLASQLMYFPNRLLQFVAIPAIGKLCLTNNTLWEFAFPIFELIAHKLSHETFQYLTSTYFIQGLTSTTNANETMFVFLYKIYFLLNNFDKLFFQNNIVVLFVNALDKQHVLLQNLVLERLWDERIVKAIEDPILSEKLIPAICKEACKNTDSNIKIQALYILSIYSHKLNKDYVVTNILPSLKYITDNDRGTGIAMAVVGCYEAISDALGPEYISSAVIPTLLPLLIDPMMDKKQFETIVNLIKSLLKKLCDKRTVDLRINPITFGEITTTAADPFANAKQILQNTRNMSEQKEADYKPSISLDAPPLPNTPPPPLPSSAPPPLPAGYAPTVPSSYAPAPPAPVGYQPNFSSSNLTPMAPYTSSFAASNSLSTDYSPPIVPLGSSTVPPANKPPPVPPVPPSPSGFPSDPTPLTTASTSTPSTASNSTGTSSTASKSTFSSWFGSKSSTNTTKSNPVEDSGYQPPATFASTTPPPSTQTSSLDMDDFMSSFSKSSVSSTPATSTSTSSKVPPPATNVSSTTFFGGSDAYKPPSTASTSAYTPSNTSYLAPGSVPAATTNMMSIEEQLKQTQAEIARLSSSIQPSQTKPPTTQQPVQTTPPVIAPPSTATANPQTYSNNIGKPITISGSSGYAPPSVPIIPGPTSTNNSTAIPSYSSVGYTPNQPTQSIYTPPAAQNTSYANSVPQTAPKTTGYTPSAPQPTSYQPTNYQQTYQPTYQQPTQTQPTQSMNYNTPSYNTPTYGYTPGGYNPSNSYPSAPQTTTNPSAGYANPNNTMFTSAPAGYATAPTGAYPTYGQPQPHPSAGAMPGGSTVPGYNFSGHIGTFPNHPQANTTYQPPNQPTMMMNNNAPRPATTNPQNNVSSAFDFLN